MNSERLLTKKEVAAYLGVTETTIDNYVKKGILTKAATGGAVRFHPDQIKELACPQHEQTDRRTGTERRKD